MFRPFSHHWMPGRSSAGWPGFRHWGMLVMFLLLAPGGLKANGQSDPAAVSPGPADSFTKPVLTNTVQFKKLSRSECLDEGAFQLQGVATLVDTNRNLVVLQDATGAVALHFDMLDGSVQAGWRVSLEGTHYYPYVVSFPDYPYHPSGREIRTSFEGPTDWGEYYLSRMRGGLHPPVTGEYTFWIASDNSSDLWLSQDETPSQARKIAFIADFGWVKPREWSRFPSQRSEPIHLEAGATYYIEARQEQTTKGDNLAVAWSGPGLEQSVIAGRYLTPWRESGGGDYHAPTNGILREYWTNYSAGNLGILAGPTPSESAFSVQRLHARSLGPGQLPAAGVIAIDQPLPPDKNFCWVRTEGTVTFAGGDGQSAVLELANGEARMQVHALQWDPSWGTNLNNARVRVEGVCEGGHDQNGVLVPSLIWAAGESCLSLSQPAGTHLNAAMLAPISQTIPTNADPVIEGFYGTHGVVTFNDQVFGKDCLYVQGDTAAIAVSLKGRRFQNHLVVGQWLELGGSLHPGRNVPIMVPMVVSAQGWHALPEPMSQPRQFPIPGSRDGRWTEVEGVVHSVNANGTLSVGGKDGVIYLWVGQTSAGDLSGYEDARLRVRGVLSLTLLEAPVLLIPSREFLNVVEAAPAAPFNIAITAIAELPAETGDYSLLHRARIRGRVLYRAGRSLIIQDASGGLRTEVRGNEDVTVGETVEAIGFPASSGSARLLTEARVKVVASTPALKPKGLDLAETLAIRQNFTLVQTAAILLNQKDTGAGQVLELEEHQRVFTATLADGQNHLPPIVPGSRVSVTGVFEDGTSFSPSPVKGLVEGAGAGSLNLLLRTPEDVVVLKGPPWWTLRRTAFLVGTLLTVLLVNLLWVYLLRRRLVRQQAARLLFSRQILQGQESERQRIAVNLHDSLGQDLLVIKHQARLAMQSTGDEADRQNRLNKISEITSEAIEEVRQITHDLRPYQLDRLGLTQAIRAVVNQASENSPVLIASYLDAIDGIFDKESEIHFYRIVQEALNNILKHSAATEAAIVVKNLADAVALSIRDNGCGFDAEQAGSTTAHDIGYGLIGMRERARILGGRFLIDSRPAGGTSVTIEIPKPLGNPDQT